MKTTTGQETICNTRLRTNWRRGSTLVIKFASPPARARLSRKMRPMTRVIPVTRPASRIAESFPVQILHEKINPSPVQSEWPICKSE